MEKGLKNNIKEKLIPNKEERSDFRIYSPEKTIEIVGELKGAFGSRNEEIIRKVLGSSKNWESLIVRRGKNSENIKYLKAGVDFLIKKEFGSKENFLKIKTSDVINWIHETGLPENILSNMMRTFYHLIDKKDKEKHKNENAIKFFRIFQIIEENEDSIKDKNVIYDAEHVLASWEKEVCNNVYAANKLNVNILVDKEANPIILAKARFGIAYNRKLKPKEKAEEFEKIFSIMNKLGDTHDAIQAMSVAAESYLSLARNQIKTGGREAEFASQENLVKVEMLVREALKRAQEIKYPNAKIRAIKVYIKLFKVTGYKKKVASWERTLAKIEESIKLNKE